MHALIEVLQVRASATGCKTGHCRMMCKIGVSMAECMPGVTS